MKKKLFLLGVFALGVFLRFYRIGAVPAHLNRDEAAIGYNAYSILKTGHDEHGVFLPINVESFGDWKLPVYIYATLPGIAIFGLSDWVIKLPAVIAGSAVVLLTFLLTSILLKNYTETDQSKMKFPLLIKKYLPLCAAGVVAVAPWGIHLSRLTYEAGLALALFLLGWWLTEKYKDSWRMVFGVFFLALTMLTYHSYQAIIPVFGLTWLFFNFSWLKEKWQKNKIVLVLPALVVVFFATLLLFAKTSSASTTKFSGLSIFEAGHYRSELFFARTILTETNFPAPLQSLYVNTYWLIARTFFTNLLATFSPQFLFISGGGHGSHNVSGLANFYLFELILLVIGLVAMLRSPLTRFHKLLVIWLLIAALPAIITVEPAHSVRAAALLVPLAILIASGLLQLLSIKRWLKFPLAFFYLFAIFYFFITYFTLAPIQDFNRHEWYFRNTAQELLTKKDAYDAVFIPMLRRSPYIYLLFYWQYDPALLSENLHFLPADEEGFVYAEQLANVFFTDPDWAANEGGDQKILYILEDTQLPEDKYQDPRYTILKTHTHPAATKTLLWVEFNPDFGTFRPRPDSTNTVLE